MYANDLIWTVLITTGIHFYAVNYKKTRPRGGGALFLEMYRISINLFPGILMNLI